MDGVRWARQRLGRWLPIYKSGGTRYVMLTADEMRKLLAPSTWQIAAMIIAPIAGIVAAKIMVWGLTN